MKKLLVLLLTIAMAISMVACSSEATLSIKSWFSYASASGVSLKLSQETLVYDVKVGENTCVGTLTLTFKGYDADTSINTYKISGNEGDEVTTSNIEAYSHTVKSGNYTLEGTLTFPSGDYEEDSMYYFCEMNSSCRPIYAYRRLTLGYEATASESRYNTETNANQAPQSYFYSATYDGSNYKSVCATRKAFGSNTYTIGTYETIFSGNFADTLQLIYVKRSASILGESNGQYVLDVVTPSEKHSKSLAINMSNTDIAVSDGEYLASKPFEDDPDKTSVSCYQVTLAMYNSNVKGMSYTYYISKVGLPNSGEKAKNVPVKMVEGKVVYTLRSVTTTK